MKAEAQWRNGQSGEAVNTINQLRLARGANTISAISADGQEILDERGFELYWEGHRRTDLIRFGKFTEAYAEKPATDETKKLFPIPQSAIDTNPNLVQNPGY